MLYAPPEEWVFGGVFRSWLLGGAVHMPHIGGRWMRRSGAHLLVGEALGFAAAGGRQEPKSGVFWALPTECEFSKNQYVSALSIWILCIAPVVGG